MGNERVMVWTDARSLVGGGGQSGGEIITSPIILAARLLLYAANSIPALIKYRNCPFDPLPQKKTCVISLRITDMFTSAHSIAIGGLTGHFLHKYSSQSRGDLQ